MSTQFKSKRGRVAMQEQQVIEKAVAQILSAYKLEGANFSGTPKRVSTWLNQFMKISEPTLTVFPLRGKPGMIVVKNYVTWSLCPHHLLPVRYVFRIGYIPSRLVLGLSKLPRIADYLCSRLLLQEEIPYEVVKRIDEAVDPKGSGCTLQGEHLCMQMRGIRSSCVQAASSSMSGVFLISEATREEFLQL